MFAIDENRTCGLPLEIKGLGLKKTKAKKKATSAPGEDDRVFRNGAAAALAGDPCDTGATEAWIAGWKSVTKKQKKEYEQMRAAASEGMRAVAKFRWAKPSADREQPRQAGLLGGRPRIPTPCARCGVMCESFTAARKHKCAT